MTQTIRTRTGVEVQSPHTHQEAIQRLQYLVDNGAIQSGFARDLVKTSRTERGLTQEQLNWAHVLVVRRLPLLPIAELFAQARRHLQSPRIHLRSPGGKRVDLLESRSGRGRICVLVDGAWAGDILPTGEYDTARFDQRVFDYLKGVAQDPAGAIGAAGRLEGRCSFCSRPLRDERSTRVGYGPVCAERFGLAWGEAA